MIHKKTIAIAILIIFIAIYTVNNAAAMTLQMDRYVASKAFPENICQEKLLEGAIAPHKSENWIANPDLKPKNWACYNNDENCMAKEIANKYLQNAIQETDPCKQAFNLGIYSTFTAFSQSPGNWLDVDPICNSEFEQEIEKKVTDFETGWQIIKECPIRKEEGTVALNYSNTDLNRLTQAITTGWNQVRETDLNLLTPLTIPEEEKGTLYDIIEQLVDQNKVIGAETLDKKAILDLWNYSCFLTSSRKEEYYQKWQQLDETGKGCLSIYLAQNNATAYSLAANCTQLGAGMSASYNQQALSMAQYQLMTYSRLGFGEAKCRQIQIPTYIGGEQFTQPNQQTVSGIEFCEYVPKNIPQGCLLEFRENDVRTQNAYNDGFATGLFALIVIAIICATFIYLSFTRGD